ncbi:NAD(P)H dehydrogenase [Desulfocarbo indianensis]|nr:NAD(P)H dehydrogenase [Desulfocarbo indianensis]
MNILLVLGHPSGDSFCAAIAQSARTALEELGHEVIFHDLYREGFDPLISAREIPQDAPLDPVAARHCRELAQAEGIVVVHPNYWGQPPAMLKGWIDRVFRPGVAYRFLEGDGGEGVPEGLLKARLAVVLNTSNTFEDREMAVFGDPLENIWRKCLFQFCGVPDFYRHTFRVIVTSSLEQRRQWLEEAAQTLRRLFPRA